MSNLLELENEVNKLKRVIGNCCNKPKIVEELPLTGNSSGFVIFEDNLYFWDGDSWELSGSPPSDPPTGLEALDEGNGIGWRLIGRNPLNYGNIGLNSIDFSFSGGASSTRGATGINSFAWGAGTSSGNASTSWGYGTSSGNLSTSWGAYATASTFGATAWGASTLASASYSTANGINNTANSFSSTVIGHFATIGVGQTIDSFVSTDEIFKVGNGADSGNRSDAFLILKNGTITAPSLTNALITTAGNKALISKEYFDANASQSQLQLLTETTTGWRLLGRNAANFGNIGAGAVDFSNSNSASATRGATGTSATAFGTNTTASNTDTKAWGSATTASATQSTAWGTSNTASGNASTVWGMDCIASSARTTAFGYNCTASGNTSVAWGNGTVASSWRATAFGRLTTASGYGSTTWGYHTIANSFYSTTLGHFATVGIGQTVGSIVSSDELFKIGNGVDNSNRSDAFTIFKNAVQIQGGITAAEASLLTPVGGMSAYVTTTDATFTSVGFWDYENATWIKR